MSIKNSLTGYTPLRWIQALYAPEGVCMDDLSKMKKLFGARIRSIRKAKKMTQELLAEKADMNPVYLSNIERGRENPTLHLLLRLSMALRVEVWEMFDYKQEVNSRQLRDAVQKLSSEMDNDEKLKLAVRILRAIAR
jgi:transcriptional regulator with XRE-family HTH domain